MTDVTLVGTGGMGSAIAGNLLAAGFSVGVWNRDRARLAPLVKAGAVEARNPAEGIDSGVIFSVLANDAAVREVFLEGATLARLGAGTVHVNLATVSPALTAEAARVHAEHGIGYVAAPMFGGVPVAKAGKLNILAAGEPASIAQVLPYLEAISARVWQLGDDPAKASVAKVAGQLLIASAIQSLAEAVAIGERGGVDARTLVELFTSTITPGPVYTTYGTLIAEERYIPPGFTPALGRKDVDLARDQAASTGLSLPIGDLLSSLLTEAIDLGHGEQDWASLAEVQRHRELIPAAR